MSPTNFESDRPSARFVRLTNEAAALLEAVLRNEFRSLVEAARRAGLTDETLRSLLDGEACYRSTLYSVLSVLRWRVDPQDLRPGHEPLVATVLDRPPASRDIPEIVQEFLEAPHFYHEIARLLLVHPERFRYLEKSEQLDIASKLSATAKAYNASGFYIDASRAFSASAVMQGLRDNYDGEIECLTQSMIAGWTFDVPELEVNIQAAFERQHRLVASKSTVDRSVVANAAAGLACGSFHFSDPMTARLLQIALELFGQEKYTSPISIVDPLLATRRREAHLLGRTERDAGLAKLKDIMVEFKAKQPVEKIHGQRQEPRSWGLQPDIGTPIPTFSTSCKGSIQGVGNTAICAACLLEERVSQSKSKAEWDELITFLEDPENQFPDASTWVRSFSGLGLGRLYIAKGEIAKGCELIELHGEEIRLHGFTPGRPMAERNKLFFSPEPLGDQEKKIFGACAFKTKLEFPIPENKVHAFITAVEDRFHLHHN